MIRVAEGRLMIGRAPLRLAIALALAGTVVLAGHGRAWAEPPADCTVFEIKASNPAKGGIDPALKPLEKKLQKGAFKAWKRFDMLAKHQSKVTRMKAEEVALVPGKLSVLLRGVVREEGRKARLRLSITVDDKAGKRLINTGTEQDSADYFLIVDGRLVIPGGDYILALSCVAP